MSPEWDVSLAPRGPSPRRAIASEALVDTRELEALLDGAQETDSLEFKGAMPWSCDQLVKDILAMANVTDGGVVVVGVEDGTLQRQGLDDQQVASYDVEIMRDQVARYADPHVIFSCEIVDDTDGRRFVVINVRPFDEIPVVCRRDGKDVHAGTIYFRSRAGRPRSARVDNSTDMREIILRAASSSLSALRRVGFQPVAAPAYDYNAELGDL
jgi:predicted HTH transcriptional regulator